MAHLIATRAELGQISGRALKARRVWQRLARNPVSVEAVMFIGFLFLCAVFAPWMAPYDPDATDAASSLTSVSAQHPFGTDIYGRDQLSRIIYAARIDLLVPFAATFGALAIGSIIGAVSGYSGRWLDQIIMRVVDAVMAFPALVLAMGMTAALGNSIGNLILVIGITQVPVYLRLMRG